VREPDRRRHRLRHHPAGVRAGRSAGVSARPAAPIGCYGYRNHLAHRGRTAAHPNTGPSSAHPNTYTWPAPHHPPYREPDPDRPPGQPPAPAGTMPPWLQERLFDRRIVMLPGPLTIPVASYTAAALLSLDTLGPETVQLHLNALAEPHSAGAAGTAEQAAAAAGEYLSELDELVVRLTEATGQPRSRIEDDFAAGSVRRSLGRRAVPPGGRGNRSASPTYRLVRGDPGSRVAADPAGTCTLARHRTLCAFRCRERFGFRKVHRNPPQARRHPPAWSTGARLDCSEPASVRRRFHRVAGRSVTKRPQLVAG